MSALDLVPGVRRMRPDDHFMVLSETDASPMHVGALILLAVPEADKVSSCFCPAGSDAAVSTCPSAATFWASLMVVAP